MPVSQVIFQDSSLIDLTNDTVTPDQVGRGVTFHAANGDRMVGEASWDSPTTEEGFRIITNELDINLPTTTFNLGSLSSHIGTIIIPNLSDSTNIKYYRTPFIAQYNSFYIIDNNIKSTRLMFPLLHNVFITNEYFSIPNLCTDASYMYFGSIIYKSGSLNVIKDNIEYRFPPLGMSWDNFNRVSINYTNNFLIPKNVENCQGIFMRSYWGYFPYPSIDFEDNSNITDISQMFYGAKFDQYPLIVLQNTKNDMYLNMSRIYDGAYTTLRYSYGLNFDDSNNSVITNNSLISGGRDNVNMAYMFANIIDVPTNIYITHNNINMYRFASSKDVQINTVSMQSTQLRSVSDVQTYASSRLYQKYYNINIQGNDINCSEMYSDLLFNCNTGFNDTYSIKLYGLSLIFNGNNINASNMFYGNQSFYLYDSSHIEVNINASGNFSNMFYKCGPSSYFYFGSYNVYSLRNNTNVRINVKSNSNYHNVIANLYSVAADRVNIEDSIINNNFIYDNVDLDICSSTRIFFNNVNLVKGNNLKFNNIYTLGQPITFQGNNMEIGYYTYINNALFNCDGLNYSPQYWPSTIHDIEFRGNNIVLDFNPQSLQATNIIFNCNFSKLSNVFKDATKTDVTNVFKIFGYNFNYSNCNYESFIGYYTNTTSLYLNFIGDNCIFSNITGTGKDSNFNNRAILSLNIIGNDLILENMLPVYNTTPANKNYCVYFHINGNNIILRNLFKYRDSYHQYMNMGGFNINGNNINFYEMFPFANGLRDSRYLNIQLDTNNSNYTHMFSINGSFSSNTVNIRFNDPTVTPENIKGMFYSNTGQIGSSLQYGLRVYCPNNSIAQILATPNIIDLVGNTTPITVTESTYYYNICNLFIYKNY